jgi:hypothetical protein
MNGETHCGACVLTLYAFTESFSVDKWVYQIRFPEDVSHPTGADAYFAQTQAKEIILPSATEFKAHSGVYCAAFDTKIKCWGGNTNGELGRGHASPSESVPDFVQEF